MSSKSSQEKEIEYVYWAEVKDPSYIKRLPFIEQEQWETHQTKNQNEINQWITRVRKTNKGNAQTIEFTIKRFTGIKNGLYVMEETSSPVDDRMFQAFKAIAQSGVIKRRYFLPIEDSDLKYEIDVYMNNTGKYDFSLVKVDLEVPKALNKPPELPPQFSNVIFGQKTQRTPEQHEYIQRKWATYNLNNLNAKAAS